MEKQLRLILAFHNVTEIMRFEKLCKAENMPGRIIPVPRAISTSCGLCWMADPADEAALTAFAQKNGTHPAGIYQLLL